jgi:hypothetical protein
MDWTDLAQDRNQWMALMNAVMNLSLPKGYHLDVVGEPSTPHDPESDAGWSLNSWQGHPSR